MTFDIAATRVEVDRMRLADPDFLSDERKQQLSIALTGRKMPPVAELTKQHISEAKGGRPIVDTTTGIVYRYPAEAARALDLDDGSLSRHLKGKYKSVQGRVFKYV